MLKKILSVSAAALFLFQAVAEANPRRVERRNPYTSRPDYVGVRIYDNGTDKGFVETLNFTNASALSVSGDQVDLTFSGGGSSGATLDLGDDDVNESTSIAEFATSGDTNSIFTEPSADKLLIDVSQNWPTADSATTATTATTANAGDSATAFFSSGTIEHERGGLEADVSGYTDGLYGMASGVTIDIDTVSELETAIGGTNLLTNTEGDAAYQPLEATLTDIADGTIAENLVNTANPWADNEVADDITLTNLSQISDAAEAVTDHAGS